MAIRDAYVIAVLSVQLVGCGNGSEPIPTGEASAAVSVQAEVASWRRCWSVVPIGTLGGGAVATRINRRGEVIGFSSTATGESRSFYWHGGELQPLSALGGFATTADDINDSGEIVGAAWDASNRFRAIEWSHGHVIDLGTLGGPNAEARRINNRGQIVGWATRADDASRRYGVLWDHGRIQEIGSAAANVDPDALYINEREQIAGTYSASNGEAHPFLWERGLFTDLGTLGGASASATGLNDWGDVIGRSFTANQEQHGFIWRHGRIHDMGTLGGAFASPTAINDLGFVAGDSSTAGNLDHGFLWWNGWRTDITPDVHGYVRAVAINLRNEIAGNYIARQSFVWSAGVLTQLPDIGGAVEVYDMNDDGVIAGRASDGVLSNAAIWVPGHCATSRH